MWQDIETAPKDGSWYIIINAEDGPSSCEVGKYEPLLHTHYIPEGDGGLYRAEQRKYYDWRGFNNHYRATHWMPIPPLPEST